MGIIAAIAVGGAITAYLVMRPDGSGGGSDDGGSPSTADVVVPMYTDWTWIDLYCEQGQSFDITVTGRAWHDGTPESEVGPDGLTGGEAADYRVLADANTASVIGKLDSIPEMFAVGSGTTYVCPAGGYLTLGINDTNLEGNSGEFHASVVLNG